MNRTRQREVILQTVVNSRIHPTADDIYQIVRIKMPNISLGTVYRNLSLLCNIGKIRKINVVGQADRFDRANDWHDHMICIKCGKIIDITLECSPSIPELLSEQSGLEILDYSLVAQCICQDCSANISETEILGELD